MIPRKRVENIFKIMPTFVDAVKFEKESPANTIRLVRSGDFFRAYNRSAWLFSKCIAEHKVMRKYIKQIGEDAYYLGFPEKSLLKNIDERSYKKTDLGYDISLKDTEVPPDDDYDHWRQTVETEQSSKADFFSLPKSEQEIEKEVIRRLRDFTLESKTMVECAVFLSELRHLLALDNNV